MPTPQDFFDLEIRVGTVLHAEPSPPGARKPAIRMRIDFGAELGVKQSSAQLTLRYTPAELVGRQVIAVTNIGTRRIAGYVSEVLVLGAMPADDDVILLRADGVDGGVANGTRIG